MRITLETSQRLTAELARLLRTTRQLGHRVAADLYGDLPSSGWAVLAPLEEHGPQRCSALAGYAGVDVSVASRQVAALERVGYVERRPDPQDGRASLISLSDVGAAALAHTRDVRSQWARSALDDWTEDEARQFAHSLEKLADGLDRAGRPAAPLHPGAAPAAPALSTAPHHPQETRA
ncbi:MarR family winged helix-turn-helix transcriptional regulator [Modestobacter roseus]|uniref:DNA-binding MarR family transcriptional regulator n=1 Tax=Modestobacter roseus TaxID=1181884 RepID=A0A562IUB5_9ACTN|nr:MarR family transcriptional regulator [Modestobacter roseus]MQA32937.1 MarR family transcriptional regulator [Modestobacter roseus]TWH74611.1 DNA-binding MarR family transcriptional regulator [Modestobacter roseus]